MKCAEFVRELERKGVTFKKGKGSHRIASYNGKKATVPFHKGKEIAKGTMEAIKRDLGL